LPRRTRPRDRRHARESNHKSKTYPLFGAVELTHPEIAEKIGRVLNRQTVCQQVDINQFAQILSSRPKGPAQTPPQGCWRRRQSGQRQHLPSSHLHEAAIDHNGIFAGEQILFDDRRTTADDR
jgi:hypothetical protein